MIELNLASQLAQDVSNPFPSHIVISQTTPVLTPYQQVEFAVEPHPQLYPYEREQWRRLYDGKCKLFRLALTSFLFRKRGAQLTGVTNAEIMRYNPEEPRNVEPREGLRRLHSLAVARQDFWASQQPIAPALPRPG